ncbi:hypothetical protein BDF14DRAFT_1738561, partial [Spinellus fusiger]
HEEIVNIYFDTKLDFQIWFKNVTAHHASWTIRTTHYSGSNFKFMEGLPESSIAMIKLPKEKTYYICDHAVLKLKHINHNPLELSDMVSSRLPPAIKLWIKKQVDSNMDWKAIKAGLCMTDEDLDTVSIILWTFIASTNIMVI